MKLATWNINSIKVRLLRVVEWLARVTPDVVLLQEIKSIDENFPVADIAAAGYQAVVHGQKSHHGVATLVRNGIDFTLRQRGLPGDEADGQARYLEIALTGKRGSTVIGNLYLPNGNPVLDDGKPSAKFRYKLAWMDRLIQHASGLLAEDVPCVLAGDYNIIPAPEDCWDVTEWSGDALYHPESLAKFRTLTNLGFQDAFRLLDDRHGQYSFWDYQKGRWQSDQGIRIDHFMLSPSAADQLSGCHIDRWPRGRDRASDHTAVVLELAPAPWALSRADPRPNF
jgi:exodeoxyribonuclease-3